MVHCLLEFILKAISVASVFPEEFRALTWFVAPLISNLKCWNCFVHSFGGGYKVFILREDQLPPPSIKFYPNNLEH